MIARHVQPKGAIGNYRRRLKLAGAGLALVCVGVIRILDGIQVVTHWTGQPLFSWGLVAAGCLCILLSMIPVAWVAKAVDISRVKTKHLR
jgi:hypothetical protein